MRRDKIIAKLLEELPGLRADYKHLAQDEGKVDAFRQKRIRRIGSLILKLQTGLGN